MTLAHKDPETGRTKIWAPDVEECGYALIVAHYANEVVRHPKCRDSLIELIEALSDLRPEHGPRC